MKSQKTSKDVTTATSSTMHLITTSKTQQHQHLQWLRVWYAWQLVTQLQGQSYNRIKSKSRWPTHQPLYQLEQTLVTHLTHSISSSPCPKMNQSILANTHCTVIQFPRLSDPCSTPQHQLCRFSMKQLLITPLTPHWFLHANTTDAISTNVSDWDLSTMIIIRFFNSTPHQLNTTSYMLPSCTNGVWNQNSAKHDKCRKLRMLFNSCLWHSSDVTPRDLMPTNLTTTQIGQAKIKHDRVGSYNIAPIVAPKSMTHHSKCSPIVPSWASIDFCLTLPVHQVTHRFMPGIFD